MGYLSYLELFALLVILIFFEFRIRKLNRVARRIEQKLDRHLKTLSPPIPSNFGRKILPFNDDFVVKTQAPSQQQN